MRPAHGHGRINQAHTTRRSAVHRASNTGNGRSENGAISCANAGEYRYVETSPTPEPTYGCARSTCQ